MKIESQLRKRKKTYFNVRFGSSTVRLAYLYILFGSLQLIVILFAGLFLQNQATCKPQDSQHPDERSIEEELQPTQAGNETSGDGSRSQVEVNLRAICPRMYRSTSTPSNLCVRWWHYCPTYNLYEAECKRLSRKCLAAIPVYGIPKCSPIHVYKSVSNGVETKSVIITKNCECACCGYVNDIN